MALACIRGRPSKQCRIMSTLQAIMRSYCSRFLVPALRDPVEQCASSIFLLLRTTSDTESRVRWAKPQSGVLNPASQWTLDFHYKPPLSVCVHSSLCARR